MADYNGKLLYNFSIIGNKINKFFDLKPVAPILEPELISYATHLSPESKYDSNENKGKLLAADNLGMPNPKIPAKGTE